MLPCIVICGGLGTRLRPVVQDRPKILAPLGERLFIDVLIDRLAAEGFNEIIFAAGYRASMIEEHVTSRSWDVRISVICEPEQYGTGGAIRFSYERSGLTGDIVALNGDTFFSGSISKLVAFHSEVKAKGTIALVEVENSSRYGSVLINEERRIVAFNEKSSFENKGLINAGVYVLSSDFVSSIPSGRKISIEHDIFPHWISDSLYGIVYISAVFLDIGTPEDYARAIELL